MIRISTKVTGDAPYIAAGNVSITDACGAVLHGVTGLKINMDPDECVTASLTVQLGPVDVWAKPVLTREVLEVCAASHGLRLVPIGGDDA